MSLLPESVASSPESVASSPESVAEIKQISYVLPEKITMCLEVKRLTRDAKVPTRATPHSAGYDLYYPYGLTDTIIPPFKRELIPTGIAISVPYGTYGRIAPRSGLALRSGIDVMAGVIDIDYRGEVGIILVNLSDTDFIVKSGDRVAQLILERISNPEIVEVENLSNTNRGIGGFGSTGV
jgi:dUTP pyrophosphatase